MLLDVRGVGLLDAQAEGALLLGRERLPGRALRQVRDDLLRVDLLLAEAEEPYLRAASMFSAIPLPKPHFRRNLETASGAVVPLEVMSVVF